MFEIIYKLIACHLIGDYPLQCDFLAKTKGENLYHLLVHCLLYTVPFAFCFGVDYRIIVLFVSHVVIDAGKAKFKVIGYVSDQVLHYLFLMAIYGLTEEM